jgi:hypothetical protein
LIANRPAEIGVRFDRRLMVQFRGSVITSDTGLLPYRELGRRVLGLTDVLADAPVHLADAPVYRDLLASSPNLPQSELLGLVALGVR